MSSDTVAPSPVRRTPVVTTPAARARFGEIVFKLENLQITGSFKLRGAVERVARLSREEHTAGVVGASAGNHGAGLALAALQAGLAATIVVPRSTPENKRMRIAGAGAIVVVAGENYDEAEAEARQLAEDSDAVFVSPFDDEAVIAGNGDSLALEIVAQVPSLRRVICPVGGGGLIGGLARTLAPLGVEVIGVQPIVNCAMYESLQLGRALTVYQGRPTVAEGCDGAVAQRTYDLVAAHATRLAVVSEEAIRRAVAFAYFELGQIVECSGAVGLAGLLEQEVHAADEGTTVCLLSGGNIDQAQLTAILAESSTSRDQ